VTGRVGQLQIIYDRPIHSNVIPNPSVCGYNTRTARVLITSRNELGSRHECEQGKNFHCFAGFATPFMFSGPVHPSQLVYENRWARSSAFKSVGGLGPSSFADQMPNERLCALLIRDGSRIDGVLKAK
jgi:hypothetical protein